MLTPQILSVSVADAELTVSYCHNVASRQQSELNFTLALPSAEVRLATSGPHLVSARDASEKRTTGFPGTGSRHDLTHRHGTLCSDACHLPPSHSQLCT